MKKVISFLLLVALVGCGRRGPVEITGSLDRGEYTEYLLYLYDGEKQDTLSVDEQTGSFACQVECDTPQFIYLKGYMGDGTWKEPIEQALYIEPGKKVNLNIQLQNKIAHVSVAGKDRDNNALTAYNYFIKKKNHSIWYNPPKVNELKDSIAEVYTRLNEVKNEYEPTEMVKDYLDIQAYVAYVMDLEITSYAYAGRGEKLPDDIEDILPPVYEVLNTPLAFHFDGWGMWVLRYLRKKCTTPEEEIQLLRESFTVDSIIKFITRSIAYNFMMEYDYANNDFDEGLERFKKMLVDSGEVRTQMLQDFEAKRYAVPGASLPDVELEDPDGKFHKLSDFKGKYLYIDLWASWCGPCCAEVPHLQKLEKSLKNPAVTFISISIDKDKKAWKKKMKELNMHGNQYIITGRDFTTMLNVQGIPHFLLYSKEGTLMIYKAPRPSSGEQLKKILSGLK